MPSLPQKLTRCHEALESAGDGGPSQPNESGAQPGLEDSKARVDSINDHWSLAQGESPVTQLSRVVRSPTTDTPG